MRAWQLPRDMQSHLCTTQIPIVRLYEGTGGFGGIMQSEQKLSLENNFLDPRDTRLALPSLLARGLVFWVPTLL